MRFIRKRMPFCILLGAGAKKGLTETFFKC